MPEYDASHFTPPAPLAGITILHPSTGRAVDNVLMLVDTGADVTLVPAEIVQSLGVDRHPRPQWVTPCSVAAGCKGRHM